LPIPSTPPHRSSFPPLGATLLVATGLLGLSLGCRSDQIMHYRVPKESGPFEPGNRPTMPPQPMGARTGETSQGQPPSAEVPAPPRPEGGLKWALPKGWSELPGGGMRYATFKTPFEGRLEATVVVLPGPAGGELANVNRWRNQISLPPLDEPGLAKARTTLTSKAGAVNVYDFTSEGSTKSRLVAGYITTPDGNTWFLKLTGDVSLVAKAKPDFTRILGSLHLD
jgi:hypothetical protein